MSKYQTITVKAIALFMATVRERKEKGKNIIYKSLYLPLVTENKEATGLQKDDVVQIAIINIKRKIPINGKKVVSMIESERERESVSE